LQPNADTDDGITPLLSAVAAGSLACLEILIQVSLSIYQPLLSCTANQLYSVYVLYHESWNKL